MNLTKEEKRISSLINSFLKSNHNSKDKAISSTQICKAFEKNKIDFIAQDLRKYINYLRSEKSSPIVASSKGYWFTKDKEEIHNQIQSLKSREIAIMKARLGLEKLL